MRRLIAMLTMKEDLESPIELSIYRDDQEIAEGRPLEVIELTNVQIAELVVNQGIEVVRTNNDREPLDERHTKGERTR